MKSEYQHQIEQLLYDAGVKKSLDISPCHRISEDLGLDGQRAEAFFREFSRTFGININEVDFSSHLTDEASRVVHIGLFLFPALILASVLSYFFVDYLLEFRYSGLLNIQTAAFALFNFPATMFGLLWCFAGLDPSAIGAWLLILLLKLPSACALLYFVLRLRNPYFVLMPGPQVSLTVADLYRIASRKSWIKLA